MKKVYIQTEYIKLDSFLKLAGAAASGGEAKARILQGEVQVDGAPCAMRGKKIYPAMTVTWAEEVYICEKSP